MYDFIKAAIQTDYYQNKFDNDGQRFVVWYLRNIHNLDAVEAKDCLTDGAGDKQIDAVYIDNQASVIYIIQGKFYSGTIDAEPVREVLSAWVQIKDLEKLQEEANNKLKVKIAEIATALQDDYEIVFELVTTATLTASALSDFEKYNNLLSEDDSLSASMVLVDRDGLQLRYDDALDRARPYINHEFTIDPDKCMEIMVGGTKAVIAALPLRECIKIPGIKDGTLFRKNVRQSLGNSNRVNKGIARTIKEDSKNFFFYHNGITAICSKIHIDGNVLYTQELNVVNGCQSLTTIFNCSEKVKKADEAYIMFRFYEVSANVTADTISNYTNSQSAVKTRDLRSNDKNVLMMKKAYEERFTDGYFVTKRGEAVNTAKYNTDHIVRLDELGKDMIAWHSQRPIISYSETRIFDKYFTQLFHKDYEPDKMQALTEMYREIQKYWIPDNPLGINETVLAMKSYMTYHHLFAVSVFFTTINNMPAESVPNPAKALKLLKDNNLLDQVITMAATALNMGFDNSVQEAQDSGKIFSPQNWSKNKSSLSAVRSAIRTQLSTIGLIPGGNQIKQQLLTGLKMENSDFEPRWSAD